MNTVNIKPKAEVGHHCIYLLVIIRKKKDIIEMRAVVKDKAHQEVRKTYDNTSGLSP